MVPEMGAMLLFPLMRRRFFVACPSSIASTGFFLSLNGVFASGGGALWSSGVSEGARDGGTDAEGRREGARTEWSKAGPPGSSSLLGGDLPLALTTFRGASEPTFTGFRLTALAAPTDIGRLRAGTTPVA